ncbi:MAG: outer membrane beta-barrel protein [Flavobacteriales bacterium]|nr:outer membrane beta-barrel protein [Flavobacteriales bacterium]
MKKKLLLCLFLTFLSLFSFSQNFKGGVIAGIATSQVSGDALGGLHKAGLYLGVFTQLPISPISNIKMEMNYIQKGSNNPKISENLVPDISTSYIEVPISVNYYQNEIMCFEIGLQTAFLLNFSDNDLYGPIPNDQSIPFNKVDLGAFIGMNYHLTDNILLNSRISNSILPIRPHASGAIYQLNRGQYNSVLSFTLHYII